MTDVCEDFAQRLSADPDSELIITSYDVKKAFDSVQFYSLEAACDRFNLPDSFKRLLLNSLVGAVSRVRLHCGLTDPIPILTSVRQGDPMAAIAFNLLMDSLHAGFRSNPFLRDVWRS